MKRLEHEANTLIEVQNYYQTRARQLLLDGFFWSKSFEEIEGGYSTLFFKNNVAFKSFYILKNNRGQKLGNEAIKCVEPIITVPDCKIEEFLLSHNKPYIVKGIFTETFEYKCIQDFYGNDKANRSQCYLMNHIDEGLYILEKIGASESAKKAFCIHPLIQSNLDLSENWDGLKNRVNSEILALAMEYRNIANAYLSYRTITTIDDIQLSPLKDVNNMLIADKIQNYKDFIIYHSETHPRKEILNQYFKNWLIKLNIDQQTFDDLSNQIKSIEM